MNSPIPKLIVLLAAIFSLCTSLAVAQNERTAPKSTYTFIKDVTIFDGVSDKTTEGSVLIENNLIKSVGADIEVPEGATIIDGKKKFLMPGLSDAHAHLTLAANPMNLSNDFHWTYTGALITREAERMLLRGFTTIRDAGGPSYGIAKAIDEGLVPGPRIYPSGHFIGQTSGHTDFRFYNDSHPRDRTYRSFFEREWAFLADGADEVRARTREVLRLGATQIKLSVGGGASSPYDPLDTTHYSVEEIRAAVEAARDWGTYVMVHGYHDRSVMNALEAGVKSIDHGTLITKDETMAMMKKMGVIYCPQAMIFSPTEEQLASFPPAIASKVKPLRENLDASMKLARKHCVKIAFGVDSFGSIEALARQNLELASRLKWFTPIEILKQATSVNAELFELSGPRNPYQDGKLGVVTSGAYADLLLVDGNPLKDIAVLEDYEKNILLIVKDGKIYKNTLD